VARHRLERLEIPAPDGAEDGVVREAGAVGDLARGEDVAGGFHHRRDLQAVRSGRVRCLGDGVVSCSEATALRAILLSHAVYRQVLLLASTGVLKIISGTESAFDDQPNVIVVCDTIV
jgi:hypothetical protein